MTVLQALTLVFHIFLKIVNLLESLLLNSTRLIVFSVYSISVRTIKICSFLTIGAG